MNNRANTTFKSVRGTSEKPYWNEQEFVFCPSNLGPNKGGHFYFKCNGCRKRVKFLYQYSMCESPLCRSCCNIPYKQPTYRERKERWGVPKPEKKPPWIPVQPDYDELAEYEGFEVKGVDY